MGVRVWDVGRSECHLVMRWIRAIWLGECFKTGYGAVASRQNAVAQGIDGLEDQIAFVLGSLAALYNSVDDPDELWKVREKVWKLEEALGESRNKKIGVAGQPEN